MKLTELVINPFAELENPERNEAYEAGRQAVREVYEELGLDKPKQPQSQDFGRLALSEPVVDPLEKSSEE